MSAVAKALLILVCAARVASAERVVVADGDPELAAAVKTALAPWHTDVVIDDQPVADAGAAVDRADRWHARFIVWRDGDQLVVFDRHVGSVERRASHAGPLAPADAAAAALSVKTMLRLPPLAGEAADRPAPARAYLVAIGAGVAGPIAVRVGGTFAAQPVPGLGLTVGLVGESAITGAKIDNTGFSGQWTTLEIAAVAGWTLRLGDDRGWQVAPAIGIGFVRASLSGTEAPDTPRSESTTFASPMAMVAVRRSLPRGFVVGVEARGWLIVGSHTYTKDIPGNGDPAVYTVPGATESAIATLGFEF